MKRLDVRVLETEVRLSPVRKYSGYTKHYKDGKARRGTAVDLSELFESSVYVDQNSMDLDNRLTVLLSWKSLGLSQAQGAEESQTKDETVLVNEVHRGPSLV